MRAGEGGQVRTLTKSGVLEKGIMLRYSVCIYVCFKITYISL